LGTADSDQVAAPARRGRPGRKTAAGLPVAVSGTPDKPEPGSVLTWRQRKVLRAIRDSVQKRGYPPSLREIAEAVGLTSTASVSYQISVLQRKGYLHRDGRRPRTMEVHLPGTASHPAARPEPVREKDTAAGTPGTGGPPQEPAYVPLVGRIASGGPVVAPQTVKDVFPLPRRLVGDGALFLLTVAGDSMIDVAIADGDLVVVRQQKTADDGDIVAAVLDGEATVKTFKRGDGHIWLVPHNPDYAPVLADDAIILGRVVAVVRSVAE
jgi:repressor LexA